MKKTLIFSSIFFLAIFGYWIVRKTKTFGAIPTCYVNPTQIKPVVFPSKQEISDMLILLNNDTAFNALITGIFTRINAMETLYFSQYKTYWSGWKTHAEPVEYGTEEPPNNWLCEKGEKPSWQNVNTGILPATLPAQIQVSIITKTNGIQEYVINAAVKKNGFQYNKAQLGDGKITEWTAYSYE